MGKKYVFPKKEFKRDGVEKLKLCFDNGDYFSLDGSELADVSVKTQSG